ncbi:MAG TPA: glycine zipper family protein [Myxococcota bacterium]|nr:glycine zipper family protein [Myxococcota bacterium]
MTTWKQVLALAGAGCFVAACATAPTGPAVLAFPGSGKSFADFQNDDHSCRSWAFERIGLAPGQPVAQGATTGAAIGTAIGAAAGTLVGVAAGDPGAGAAVGAGTGLLVGSASGAQADAAHAQSLQARYDAAYAQCMYANGDQVPGAAPPTAGYAPLPTQVPRRSPRPALPPPPGSPPPPPPPAASPPPPPPGSYTPMG